MALNSILRVMGIPPSHVMYQDQGGAFDGHMEDVMLNAHVSWVSLISFAV